MFSAYAIIHGKKHKLYLPADKRVKKSIKYRLKVFLESIPALLMPVIILGGIYGGIFTPSEAGCIAAVYGFIAGFFIYKELKFSMVPGICVETIVNTSMIMAIIGAAGAFGSLMTKYQVTAMVSKSITAMTSSPIVFLLLFNLVMLLVGMFMEANAAIILITRYCFRFLRHLALIRSSLVSSWS